MKKKIIEKSIELFEMKGFSETSIQDVVEALGVTKGTFYYYFDSKEQLLMNIHRMYIDELLNLQKQIIENRGMNQKTKLFETVKLLITQIKVTGRSARVFFREMMHLKPESAGIIKQKRKKFRLNIQTIIESGIKNGEFKPNLQADLVTFAVLGMCNWSYNWFDPEGPVADEELVKAYIDTLLNGIAN